MPRYKVDFTFPDESATSWEGDADDEPDAESQATTHHATSLAGLTRSEATDPPPPAGEYHVAVSLLGRPDA